MMNSKSIFKILLCFAFFTITSANDADAQTGRALKSVVTKPSNVFFKIFGKKAAKEASEEALEQATKKISKEITQRAISKNAANSLIDPAAAKISRDALQQVYDINIKKTLAAKVGKEVSEVALRSTSKEFAQYIGKSASKESVDYFAKKLGTEASQEIYEVSAKKSMQKSALDTHNSWSEILKDKYHIHRLELLRKIERSKLYEDLFAIYKKGPITLTVEEMADLMAKPKNLKKHLAKIDEKDVIEFLIRLKMGNPEQVRQILKNTELRQLIGSSIKKIPISHATEGYCELIVKHLDTFLFDSKWGKNGDFLAMAWCKLLQDIDNVIYKTGGKAGSANAARFYNELPAVVEKSKSAEELFINLKKHAKKNMTPDEYDKFLKISDEVFETAEKKHITIIGKTAYDELTSTGISSAAMSEIVKMKKEVVELLLEDIKNNKALVKILNENPERVMAYNKLRNTSQRTNAAFLDWMLSCEYKSSKKANASKLQKKFAMKDMRFAERDGRTIIYDGDVVCAEYEKGVFYVKRGTPENPNNFLNLKQMPNVTYNVDGSMIYTTDQLGRIKSVSVENVKLNHGNTRNSALQAIARDEKGGVVGEKNGKIRALDDGGHLVADVLDGPCELINIVPMANKANKSEIKSVENFMRKCLNEGKKVSYNCEIIYGTSSLRPTEFKIIVIVDGTPNVFNIRNI